MMVLVRKIAFTILSAAVCLWLLSYAWQERSVTFRRFPDTLEAAKRLDRFPEAQYHIGYQSWFRNRTEDALTLFQRTVKGNIYHMDAWLKIGQVEAGRGNSHRAAEILEFTHRMTSGVHRWKWQQTLLAMDLNQPALFQSLINDLIQDPVDRGNALLVLDSRFNSDAAAVMTALKTENQTAYLDWLIRTDRVQDAQTVWMRLSFPRQQAWEPLVSYVHFLLRHKQVTAAKTAWRHAGYGGIHNPAFEQELLNRGFGWYGVSADDRWAVKRIFQTETEPNHCVQITFNGKENANFYHFYQIVPVEPNRTYRLGWRWRSRNVTTDQRPFVEVAGYACDGLLSKSPVLAESMPWQEVSMNFEVPEPCQAAIVRLRRLPSRRIDSKINGKVWLDDFHLNEIESYLTEGNGVQDEKQARDGSAAESSRRTDND